MVGESELFNVLRKQGYHVVGKHSAVKRCKWFRESMIGNGQCYKNRFYGIKSHQCVQCTPSLQFCTNACKFCWRVISDGAEGMPDNFKWDEPGEIVEGILKEQMRLVSGYGGNEKTPKEIYEEAKTPGVAAISLAGEPTVYPKIGEFILEFGKRGVPTFLVTNGTLPERLEGLGEKDMLPTQLYISMVAPDEKAYMETARPKSGENWKKYLRSLEVMKGLGGRTRRVLRMTLVKGLNNSNVEGYAKQVAIAEPEYVEVKSFAYVGGARDGRGLKLEDMLRMEEIEEFAKELSGKTGYRISEKHVPSRVVLLCRNEEAESNRIIGGSVKN